MLPYFITFALSVFLFFLGKEIKLLRGIFYFLALVPPVLLAGLRDTSIGTDTSLYPIGCFYYALHCNSLGQMLAYDLDIEGMYKVLTYLSAQIAPIFNVHLLISHTIILGTLFFAFKKSNINLTVAFLFFFLLYYATSLNIARQFLAMPFCLVALAEFRRKKYFTTSFCMLVAIGFHHSSLFFILILALYYLAVHNKQQMNTKEMYFFVAFIVVVCIVFFAEILQMFINTGVADTKYQERYGSADMYGASIPISMLALTSFNCFTYLFFVPANVRAKAFGVFSQYILLLALLFCFSGLISVFATRLGFYFTITSLVCVTWAAQRSNILYFLLTSAFYVFYWLMTFVVAKLDDVYPYKSIILGI